MLCLFGMISIGASAEEIPNDEIWYTSSDGAVITPQGTIDFGANIISNTYANGKGIIKYDGNVTSIGYQAFYYCSRLTSVTIPNSVTSIGNHAFFYCSGLTSVAIPNSVTSIGDWAFSHCSNLTSVTIPNSVIEIGDAAFYDCSGLRSVTIGNSLERIGSQAFDACWNIVVPITVVHCDCVISNCPI